MPRRTDTYAKRKNQRRRDHAWLRKLRKIERRQQAKAGVEQEGWQ